MLNNHEAIANWLLYLNPCGAELAPGVMVGSCISDECGSKRCLAKAAHAMANFIARGSTPEAEIEELGKFLASESGQEIVGVDGSIICIEEQDIANLVAGVSSQAARMLELAEHCQNVTVPLTQAYLEACSPGKRTALDMVANVNRRIQNYIGPESGAQELVGEMRGVLNSAIAAGAGDLGLILRQAIAYGITNPDPRLQEILLPEEEFLS